MNNKIFLSIAIPTYNRAHSLSNLLNNILPQAKELKEKVEICISDNGSTDNTREVVLGFQEKYPDLINYNKNEKNLGFDVNIIKVAEMSNGDFVWLFGDDDLITDNGLNAVINFLKENKENYEKNIGLIVLRVNTYFIDEQTREKIIFYDTLEKNKPEILKIDRKDIVGLSFPQIAFISILIFNNKFLKELLSEDMAFIKQGIGTSHIHMALFSSMFLKHPHLNGVVFNKEIVCQELSQYKYYIEDKFMLHYQMQRKLNNLLLSYKYMSNDYASLITERYGGLRLGVLVDMMVMKAFKNYNYFSYFGCLRLFFKNSGFIDALIFSLVFSTLFLVPSAFLRFCYKSLLIIRHGKEWKIKWDLVSDLAYSTSRGARRRNEQPY